MIDRDMIVHFSTPASCLCSRDHFIYRYNYQNGTFELVCRIPPKDTRLFGRIKDVLARSWLGQKLTKKAGLSHVMQLASGDIVIIYDRIYVYKAEQDDRMAVALLDEFQPKFAPPLRSGFAIHSQSQLVYFGEYLNGHSRNIRVFRICLVTMHMEICFEFTRNEIKHIHAIVYDAYRNRLWITTGDLDHESAFYYTDNEFSSVQKFAGGDQSWRAITILFDEHSMEWGMDAGKDAPAEAFNKIYRYDFTQDERIELTGIGNPAYHAVKMCDGTAYLATTFEPGRLQNTPEEAALWYRNSRREWSKVAAFKYQYQPRRGVSQYGYLLLPSGICPTNHLLLSPVNVHPYHYQLIQYVDKEK
jgi:hypothetical protein